jgi:5-methylcytosine-specific restriction protein A
MPRTAAQFRARLDKLLSSGSRLGFVAVEVNAGKLHRMVGGYPGPAHNMPMCCDVMRQRMTSSDTIVTQPPRGNGASLTVRYRLPRNRP